MKRNAADYGRAGLISGAEVVELIAEVEAFRKEVLEWLQAVHPALVWFWAG